MTEARETSVSDLWAIAEQTALVQIGLVPTQVTIQTHSIYASTQSDPMSVEAALDTIAATPANPHDFQFLAFLDCTSCGGEGFNDGEHCRTCRERQEEIEWDREHAS